VETLAERLRDAGFQTSAVVNSKFLDRRYGFHRGFDEFTFLEPTHDPEVSSRVVDRALDWLETHVLLVADHGESLGEAGYLGHGSRLTEEQLRVPAVLLSAGHKEHHLDEALRLAIGLGAVRIGPDVPEIVALAGMPEAARDIARAVVGEHFSHG
jgi:hypothetical protein